VEQQCDKPEGFQGYSSKNYEKLQKTKKNYEKTRKNYKKL